MPRLVSWLERAIQEAPQAKASAQQWLASLRKSPFVNQEEVADRGLDQFLAGQPGTVDRSVLEEYLTGNPMPTAKMAVSDIPQYQEYSTPGARNYRETVFYDPQWDKRSTSEHFPSYIDDDQAKPIEGYQFHTRAGQLPTTNLGSVNVLDELQSDVEPGRWARRFGENPPPTWPRPIDVHQQLDPFWARVNTGQLPQDEMRAMLPWESDRGYEPAQGLEAIRAMRERAAAEGWLDDTVTQSLGNLEQLTGQAQAVRDMPKDLPLNIPGRESWKWHGMADALNDAVIQDKDALVWPSSDVQYRRYFQRAPEHYEQNAADADELLDDITSSDNFDSDAVQGYQEEAATAREAANAARGSMRMYQNLYDKEMPRHKRWRQLGLEPKLVDLQDIKPINPSNALSTESRKNMGKYWMVQLTPEIRERLRKSGIPYYMVGGAAVLGEEYEGALD